MNYQFVVIGISEKRRNVIKEQFEKLDKKCKVIFLEASTPSNSEEYIKGIEKEYDQKVACCLKSHIEALKVAAEDSSTDFTIVLEDDVSFHKTQFLNMIEEIIAGWNEKMLYDTKIMSIGWVPLNNCSHYINMESNLVNKCILGSKVLNTFKAVGLQAYIVKNTDMKEKIDLLIKKSYLELHGILQKLVKEKSSKNPNLNVDVIPSDYSLNWIFDQSVLFPPIAIEQCITTTIGNHNRPAWDKFFKDYEALKDDYMIKF
jgi:hypothetical protein